MSARTTGQHIKYMLKSLGVVGLLVVLGFAVLAGLLFSIDTPSFGVSVLVTNYEQESIEVNVRSALTDETIVIEPGQGERFVLFTGDHGDEFTRLTEGQITIIATYTDQTRVEISFPGVDLSEPNRAYYKVANGEIQLDPFYAENSP